MSSPAVTQSARDLYGRKFQQKFAEGSLTSARVIVPIVMNLLQPRSVVDVGCGTGAWLSEFRNQGVPQILGLDGEYVNREELLIPAASFRSVDLTFQLPDLGRSFDLAVSLEVAEHLPSSHGEEFVSDTLSPFVLFTCRGKGESAM